MTSAMAVHDRSRTMEEQSWWDLWNTSYRAQEQLDAVSSELFARAACIINSITRKEECRVLEVGCGTGALSRTISYASYLGLDFSPAAVHLARERGAQQIHDKEPASSRYEVADICEWEAPAELFDVVVCIDAIACIRNQSLAMRKMGNALRTGGRLVMTTVNPFVYERIRRSSSARLENGPVSHWLTREELRQLVTEAGFTIERFETIMPRGEMGILRLVNSYKLNNSFGPRVAAALRKMKEPVGLGQYSLLVAHKRSS
jgi:2-polyprenyl-3-methyl-5-hydroxy-6-metoxy-1,4-benzoquinol methylase